MGFRLAQRANGVSQLHGHVSREMFHGLWPAFDEAEVPITSITNGVHAPDLGRPRGLRPRRAARRDRRRRRGRLVLAGRRPGAVGRRLGGQARSCASGSCIDARQRLLKSCLKRGIPTAELRLGRRGARPRRADDRLRAARAVVQAADADAARPRAAQAPPAPPGAPGAADHRRQGAPRRRRRQEADPGDRPVRRRPRGPPPHRVPAELRHRAWRSRSTPAATSG